MKNTLLIISFLAFGVLKSYAQSENDCIPPDAPTTASNVTVCKGQTVKLTATGVGTISWYDAPMGGNKLGTGENFDINEIELSTTLYLEDSTCAVSSTRTVVKVTVDNPEPAPLKLKSIVYYPCTDSATVTVEPIHTGAISWYSNQVDFTPKNEIVTIRGMSTYTFYSIDTRIINSCGTYMSTSFTVKRTDYHCSGANDIARNAAVLGGNAIITSNTKDYAQGRDISTTCTTSLPSSNVIDSYYSFIADNSSVNLNVSVADPTWESSMELIDTANYTPISNQCINTIGTDQTERTYTFNNLTIGQKYEVRLELGSTSPLGHARIAGAGNTFSVRRQVGTTGISDEIHLPNKEVFKIYNIQGQEVSKNYSGLVIYKYTDGTSAKVVQN